MSSTPGEDWQNHLSVLEANRFMLENQVDCDVTFALLPPGGESVSVGAHRYQLISRSPVFFAMLSGPLANKAEEIKITDISPATFWQLLRYLYYEEVNLTEEMVFHVLYAAKKYLVTSLSSRCIDYLSTVLSPENVCAYLENSFLFDEDEERKLKRSCYDVIKRHSRIVFHSESFYQSSRETLCQVLRLDRLNVHEVDVFRAVVHWAERKARDQNLRPTPSNVRTTLGEALFLLHIPVMRIDELTKIVLPSKILSADEENLLFRFMLDRETASTDRVPFPFPRNCRNFVSTRCDVVYDGFVRHVAAASFQGGGNPQRSRWSVTFYCDHSIKVHEIGFLGAMRGHVTVTQNGFRKLEMSTETGVHSYHVGDDVQLDPGPFTIATDLPFAYTGEYFSKGVSSSVPGIRSDNDRVSIAVRDCSALCFVSHVIFAPTDEIYFVENYYNEEDSDN